MTDLYKLTVSLTKHGAHKVAELIKAYPSDQVLNKTRSNHLGIRIDEAQSRKNLSAYQGNTIPAIWDEAKQLGSEYVDDLVMIAIIFSHYELIGAMISGSTGRMKGTIKRSALSPVKSFTNFANNFGELGFATSHSPIWVNYDLSKIFNKFKLVPLIIQLLTLKLKKANWNG
ncbi:hypothetical protein ACFL36_05915, partial [Thermodesulfobacteriota bacterium]